MEPREIVQHYFEKQFHVVFWPDVGDKKGPTEKEWPAPGKYKLSDYREQGVRVGVVLGQQVSPGKFLHDVDIDWGPGAEIAIAMLPTTHFVYGRASKKTSHCFYLLPEAIRTIQYLDPIKGPDKKHAMLIELRGTKEDGTLGLQTMVPPSVWASRDDGHREPLVFRADGEPMFVHDLAYFKQRVCYSAIGMLLAKYLGKNGFGHEARLAWAGFLLRADVEEEDLRKMGEAMSIYCNNREVNDVRDAINSTREGLASSKPKKIKGGPALSKLLGEHGKTIIATINEWLGRDTGFISHEGKIIADNQDNIRKAIDLLGVELSYNEFAEKLLVKEKDQSARMMSDRALNSIWLRIDREHRFRPTFSYYEKVVEDIAHENAFHPVRDYLDKLVWDGEHRIDTWLVVYAGAVDKKPDEEVEDPDGDNADKEIPNQGQRTYLQSISSIVLVAAVRRVRKPGCKYDEMLVLESDQGMNKSTGLRTLCPSDEWFSDDLPLNVDAKQIIERTLGKWLIEASDMVGGRKADRDHLKSMLSRQIDGPARLAYAHTPVERERQFIIIGTTNSAEYLADMTGARRFWPVRVVNFDIVMLSRDRDQLWAEAAYRESTGESIRLPETLYTAATEHQEARREMDAWEETILLSLDGLEVTDKGRQQMTSEAIWNVLGINTDRRDRPSAKRVSDIMQRFGFTRQTVRVDDKTMSGYARYVKSGPKAAKTPVDDSSF